MADVVATDGTLKMVGYGAAAGVLWGLVGYVGQIKTGEAFDFLKLRNTVILGALAGLVGGYAGVTPEVATTNPLYLLGVGLLQNVLKLKDGVKVGPLLPPKVL